MSERALAPWYRPTRPQWEAAVSTWVTATGHRLGLGQVEAVNMVKERPWSVVRRVTFTHRTTYFKACGTGGSFEPALLRLLERQNVSFIPQILATGPLPNPSFSGSEDHWLLLADAGEPFRERLPPAEQVPALAPVLTHYAQLQLASLHWVDQLQALGLSDRRAQRLPALLPSLLADEVLGTMHAAEAVAELRSAVLARLPQLQRVCAQLADSAYAVALDHGDLHWGNLLLGDGPWRLLDWGDASLTHPFCSLVITFEMVRDSLPAGAREQWLTHLRAAYLQPWTALFPWETLLADFERALWAGQIVRTLNFAHMFQGAEEEVLSRWRPMIFERLSQWAGAEPPA